MNNILIGQRVYHRNVYEHRQILEVIGITKDEILLEGNYSGGTHCLRQRQWHPIKGTSVVYDYMFKYKIRKDAIEMLASSVYDNDSDANADIVKMLHAVISLTDDVFYNPEF